MTNKKFGIIIMDLSLFDFGPKPPCGYIKAKHIRPAYGKGARPVNAHRRHEEERKKQEAREAKYRKAKEQGEICYKTSPCEWRMYCYDCSKTKANQK